MDKYTIEYEMEEIEDSSYFLIPICEAVMQNNAYGDSLCIDKETNALEVCEDINIDDKEIKDFIRENFKNHKSVMGFIRRILE